MCPDDCSAGLWMVSPVSLESRLSRPLEPLRSDLRLGSLLMKLVPLVFFFVWVLVICFRLRSAGLFFCLLCCVSCLKTCLQFYLLFCGLFKTNRFPPGTIVPKNFMTF
ncbi:hypothetical protein NPIL_417311 [Nephila pilipes]|uniref:Uncharacterized protein n=1 Tax=Nephila pilipes TaxID=299642 RepID=A0A8X6MES2_NEPPI|nr:hypothetical protein NPIL_417311 [Nephila pilipes]